MKRLATFWRLPLLWLALLVNGQASAADKDPATAWQMIDQGAMVVDVRTPEEFSDGHLEGAINIPFESVAAEFAKRNIAKDTAVVLYCRSGRRSGIALEALTAAGYSKVYNGGGYETLHQAKAVSANQ